MIAPEKLFENFFDDIKIINVRLYNFGNDCLNRLTAANGGGDYTTLITLITPLLTTFGNRLGLLDVGITLQKGTTITNDQVMSAFKLTMSDKEGAIANALGGRETGAYQQFYPHGITEYSQATKTQMSILTHRVKTAAGTNSVALGITLTDLLSGFEGQWNTSRNSQEVQMAAVDDTRSDRGADRVALELALCTVVHTIGAKFPGDVPSCMDFFDFSKLFAVTHHKSITLNGTIGPGRIVQVANMEFTETMSFEVKNTDVNATFIIYLAPTATSEPGAKFVTVKATKGKRPKPADLGDLTNTFLLIKNTSAVNNGSYIVKIKGVQDTEGNGGGD